MDDIVLVAGQQWRVSIGIFLVLPSGGLKAIDVIPCRWVRERKLIWRYADNTSVLAMELLDLERQPALDVCDREWYSKGCPKLWSRIAAEWVQEDVVRSICDEPGNSLTGSTSMTGD